MNEKIKKNFIELYEKNIDAVFRFCYFRLNDRDLAMDLAQSAFTKTYSYIGDHDDVENMRALVYTIARNKIIDHYRKKKTESLDNLMEDGFEPSGDFKTDESTNTELTLNILNELSDEDRELLTMRYINELKPKEIAEITNTRVNTISVKIKRSKDRLKKILKKKNGIF